MSYETVVEKNYHDDTIKVYLQVCSHLKKSIAQLDLYLRKEDQTTHILLNSQYEGLLGYIASFPKLEKLKVWCDPNFKSFSIMGRVPIDLGSLIAISSRKLEKIVILGFHAFDICCMEDLSVSDIMKDSTRNFKLKELILDVGSITNNAVRYIMNVLSGLKNLNLTTSLCHEKTLEEEEAFKASFCQFKPHCISGKLKIAYVDIMFDDEDDEEDDVSRFIFEHPAHQEENCSVS